MNARSEIHQLARAPVSITEPAEPKPIKVELPDSGIAQAIKALRIPEAKEPKDYTSSLLAIAKVLSELELKAEGSEVEVNVDTAPLVAAVA